MFSFDTRSSSSEVPSGSIMPSARKERQPQPQDRQKHLIVQMSMNAVGFLMYGAPHRLQKESRLAQKVDYPAYGGAGTPATAVNGTSVRSSLCFSLLVLQ